MAVDPKKSVLGNLRRPLRPRGCGSKADSAGKMADVESRDIIYLLFCRHRAQDSSRSCDLSGAVEPIGEEPALAPSFSDSLYAPPQTDLWGTFYQAVLFTAGRVTGVVLCYPYACH